MESNTPTVPVPPQPAAVPPQMPPAPPVPPQAMGIPPAGLPHAPNAAASAPATPASTAPTPPAPPSQPSLVTTTKVPEKNSNEVILLVLLLIILVGVIVGGIYLVRQRMKPISTVQPETQEVVADTSVDTTPVPPVPEEPTTYKNPTFGFDFEYTNQNLQPCEGDTCVMLPASGVRVDVDTTLKNSTSFKEELMKADLFCAADGPNGSISCVNTKVDDFMSAAGAAGYKVTRTSTVKNTLAGTEVQNPDDVVYYFSLPRPVTKAGVQYQGVILSATDHTPTQVETLNTLANTFKYE